MQVFRILMALAMEPPQGDFFVKELYLPKNHFIREESMSTEDYLELYYFTLV